jgi:phosphotriesterase-related protein
MPGLQTSSRIVSKKLKMINLSRRRFLYLSAGGLFVYPAQTRKQIITVNGSIDINKLGKTLAHEHVLVDFIGADKTNVTRWDKNDVINRVTPFFLEARAAGVKTIAECTPAFLGRDVRLLKMLADKTKMQIITNTGYYGAVGNKYLPPWAFTEAAEQLSARWSDDFEYGIDGTTIRPGFIKISVDAAPEGLSDLHKKIVRAAALTHLKTGLTIYCHTGPGAAALEEIDILKNEKVDPSALVWVHAQAEKDRNLHIKAAKAGTWVSLDNITNDYDEYVQSIINLKDQGCLNRIIISHDAGYYRPGEPNGGSFTGYTSIFSELIPRLMKKGFTEKNITQLLVKNPAAALELRVRKLKAA